MEKSLTKAELFDQRDKMFIWSQGEALKCNNAVNYKDRKSI